MSTESRTSARELVNEGSKQVVVCGGGIIGVCTAYYLARKGARVTLVEKSSIACGASGKGGGILTPHVLKNTKLSDLAYTSFDLHRSLSDRLDGALTYGYQPIDILSLHLCYPPFDQPPTSTFASPLLPSWVDGPMWEVPGKMNTTEAMTQIDPRLFTKMLLSVARREHGVKLVIGKVEQVKVVDGRATGVLVVNLKKRGKSFRIFPANAVVLALGPWSNSIPLISSLFHVFSYKVPSIVLRPKNPAILTPHVLHPILQPPLEGNWNDPIRKVFAAVHARSTGEVYISGTKENAELPDDPKEIVADEKSIGMLHKIAGAVSSQLRGGEAEVVAEQACYTPWTYDQCPVIGEIPEAKGCYVATAHWKWGILTGPATGSCLADLILDGCSPVDLTPFSPTRFVRRRKHLRSIHGF